MVITDINMPRMDGLTLLAKLQNCEDRLSTVIVSAALRELTDRAAGRTGGAQVLEPDPDGDAREGRNRPEGNRSLGPGTDAKRLRGAFPEQLPLDLEDRRPSGAVRA
jgi:hypothetical protein